MVIFEPGAKRQKRKDAKVKNEKMKKEADGINQPHSQRESVEHSLASLALGDDTMIIQ